MPSLGHELVEQEFQIVVKKVGLALQGLEADIIETLVEERPISEQKICDPFDQSK